MFLEKEMLYVGLPKLELPHPDVRPQFRRADMWAKQLPRDALPCVPVSPSPMPAAGNGWALIVFQASGSQPIGPWKEVWPLGAPAVCGARFASRRFCISSRDLSSIEPAL